MFAINSAYAMWEILFLFGFFSILSNPLSMMEILSKLQQALLQLLCKLLQLLF